ncbi:MAG: DUF4394 domain-containing protein [Acidimicrobiales bacterium]
MRKASSLVLAAAVAGSLAAPSVASAAPTVERDAANCAVYRNPDGPQADLYALTVDGRLVSVNRQVPVLLRESKVVTGVQGTIVGMDVRPANGLLYAVSNSGGTGRIYTLNPSTGAATFASQISVVLAGTAFGVDFNPVPDRLRVVTDTGQNLRINVDTGAATVDGALAYSGGGDPDVTGAAYTNSVPPSPRTADPNVPSTGTTLYDIDSAADTLVIQNPPNNGTLNTVGPLGFDVTSVNGFDIDGDAGNLAYAAIALANVRPSLLARIDLATGRAQVRGVIGCAETVVALAFKA